MIVPYSTHPYIFFNKDKETITFVGFRVTKQGDLVDPKSGLVVEEGRGIMTRKLYEGLVANRVDFNEDYNTWYQLQTELVTYFPA